MTNIPKNVCTFGEVRVLYNDLTYKFIGQNCVSSGHGSKEPYRYLSKL